MIGRILTVVAVTGTLAGCIEVGDALEDPGAFACRQRGASLMSTTYEQTTANPINFDAFGYRNYSVWAEGVTFRCSVNSDNLIVSFNRM